ncbi:MAG: polysaccharide deacetylase family protein [Sphingobacteriaceae bacterium]|nr:polysaccharide deacetylase family protein [Sphingobacteriaceae bacterium]
MQNVISPFYSKERDLILEGYLLENNNNLNFTLRKKFYYSIVRPIIPLRIRQRLQSKYNSKVEYKENFISEDLIDYLKEKFNFNTLVRNLYPQSFASALILTHDVEEQNGFDFIPNVLELEEKYGFKSAWNIVPYKYKLDEGIIKLIQDSGHEIGIHGYNHDGKLYYSEKIFNYRASFINEAIKKYNAVGFRSPQVHRNLMWLQKLDIKYDASCFDYDPFQPFPGGTGSIWPFIVGKFVELPYTLPQDHTLFYVLKVKDINIWKRKAEWLLKNNGMILALTHPDYLINKNHLKFYEELLDYLNTIENTWKCLPKDMSLWWKNKFENN